VSQGIGRSIQLVTCCLPYQARNWICSEAQYPLDAPPRNLTQPDWFGPTAASMLQEIESMSDDELCRCVEQATDVGGIPGSAANNRGRRNVAALTLATGKPIRNITPTTVTWCLKKLVDAPVQVAKEVLTSNAPPIANAVTHSTSRGSGGVNDGRLPPAIQ
jgi:hypothetical protein